MADELEDEGADGFELYEPETTDTPLGLLLFCSVYVGFTVSLALLMACCWRSGKTQQQQNASSQENSPTQRDGAGGEQEMVALEATATTTAAAVDNSFEQPSSKNENGSDDRFAKSNCQPHETADSHVETNLHHAATADHQSSSEPPLGLGSSGPIQPPAINGVDPLSRPIHPPAVNGVDPLSRPPPGASSAPGRRRSASVLSGRSEGRSRPIRSWDLASRPWGHARPLVRADLVSRSLASERQSLASEEGSHASRRSRASWVSGPGHRPRSRRAMSDAASHILGVEEVEGEADFYRKKYIQRSNNNRSSNRNRRLSDVTDTSIMPPMSPDAVSPEDAADAHDRGRVSRPEDYELYRNRNSSCFQSHRCGPFQRVFYCFEYLLVLAETDYESGRIVSLACLSTMGAVADPLFRLLLLAIISNYVDTDSMVAFVLSILFIRLTTEEISGAVTDVESNLVKDALFEGGDAGFSKAGRFVQMGMIMQILVGVPVLFLWSFVMEDVVDWLVSSERIASTAADYAKVIIVDYILRGTTRAFMLPFHLSGQAHFERNIDVVFALLTLIAIVVVASNAQSPGEPSLYYIGWIQVIIGIAKTIIKIAYVALRGWLQPYREGLVGSLTLTDPSALSSFFLQVLPLFLGSLIELGEWDMLVLVVRHLGGAEVAAWAVMGVVWEVCLASTEGLGEAASVRLSFHLSEGYPAEAQLLASKIAFLACIEALVVSSILLITGPNIAVALTKDSVLENILNELMGLTALANISMTFAQIYWSLAGAQGSYGVASITILLSRWLVTIPIALVCVFGYAFEVDSLAGAVAVGYGTAAFLLSLKVFSSDWVGLSRAAQEELMPLFDDGEGLSSVDDSSQGF